MEITTTDKAINIITAELPAILGMIETATLQVQKIKAVKDEASKAELTIYLKTAKDTRKTLAALRTAQTAKLDAAKKLIMEAERSLAYYLDEHIEAATDKIKDYNNEIFRKQQAEQRRIDAERAEELKRKTSPKTIAAIENKFQAQEQAVPQTNGIAMVWDFEVIDPKIIPEGFKMINEGAIKAAIKAGVRCIDGLYIFQKPRTVIR